MKSKIIDTKSAVTLLVLGLTFIVVSSQFASAAAPNVVFGTASVDGSYTEWKIPADFFTYLYEAHKPTKPVLGNVSVRYSSGILYVLVLANQSLPGVKSDDDAWVKITGVSGNIVDGGDAPPNGAQPEFAWIGAGYDGNLNHVRGYEASFVLAPGSYEIQIHLEVVYKGNPASTAGTPEITIVIPPEFPVPETPFATTLVAVIAAAAVFVVFKRSRQKKQ